MLQRSTTQLEKGPGVWESHPSLREWGASSTPGVRGPDVREYVGVPEREENGPLLVGDGAMENFVDSHASSFPLNWGSTQGRERDPPHPCLTDLP